MKQDNKLQDLICEVNSFAKVSEKNKTVNISERLLNELSPKQHASLLGLKKQFGFSLQYTIE